MLKYLATVLIIMLFITGCSLPAPEATPPATQVSFPAAPTLTQTLAPAPSPSPSPTPTASPSPTPFEAFTVTAMVDNLNIRTNPGLLFSSYGMVKQGTALIVLGKAPGGEWILVRLPDGFVGWAFALLLETDRDLQAIPVIEPRDVQLVKGRVLDAHGIPILGVGFDLWQGASAAAPHAVVITDPNGEFFAFLPPSASGGWTIAYSAIACKSNVWKDDRCANYKDEYTGTVEPVSMSVTLPVAEVLVFTWK